MRLGLQPYVPQAATLCAFDCNPIWQAHERKQLLLGPPMTAEPQGQSAPLAAPQLAYCACSGRAWQLWAAWHSQGEGRPPDAAPLPRMLERPASRVADFTAFDHAGGGRAARCGGRGAGSKEPSLGTAGP